MRQGVGDDVDLVRIQGAITELLRISTSARVHEARMAAIGVRLSRTEFQFLTRVDDAGPLSVSRLAEILHVSQPTASRSLRQLENAGLVSRKADEADGRIAIYQVTAKGRRLRRRVQELMDLQLATALEGMGPGDRRQLGHLMEQLVGRMREGGPQATTQLPAAQ